MQVESLALFHDLTQTKSFTATARNFGVTQSAVSQSVAAMERVFKNRLIERARKRFQLTPAGEAVRDGCAQIAGMVRQLNAQLQQAHEATANVIELAVCHSIGLNQLPDSLRRFQAAHPEVRVTVRYGQPERVHQDVLDNLVDFGLTIHPQRLPGLAIERIPNQPLMLVCHPQHPLASRPSVSLMELAGERFIGLKDVPHPAHFVKMPNHLRHYFEPLEEFNEVEMVKRVVEMDGGVALLPAVTVRQEVANQTLAAVPLTGGNYFQPQGVIFRQTRHLTPVMQSLIEHLKQPEPVTDANAETLKAES